MEQNESRAAGIRRIAREEKLDLAATSAVDLIVTMKNKGILEYNLAMELCDDFENDMATALLEHARSIDDLDERIERSSARV